MDTSTKQKLVDTPILDVNLKPKILDVNRSGELEITWDDNHVTKYDAEW